MMVGVYQTWKDDVSWSIPDRIHGLARFPAWGNKFNNQVVVDSKLKNEIDKNKSSNLVFFDSNESIDPDIDFVLAAHKTIVIF